jgi:hypothetical protein
MTGFLTTVCERAVPLGASKAVLEQSTINAATVHPANGELPLPNWTATTRPRSIAVIGDAGCQVPKSPSPEPLQNCQTGWPFQQIANSAAATWQLDLVIHVGDYLYRDDPGRENDMARNPGCITAAQAASWDCVVADFFRPAENLLARAPVALTRGNHEDCNQFYMGGAGGAWFHYLADELRGDRSCVDYTAPVEITAGTLNLISVDSSLAKDGPAAAAQVMIYKQQFNRVNTLASAHPNKDYFLFTHKPMWMVKAAGAGGTTSLTQTLEDALTHSTLHRLADNIRLVLSGHVHIYQMLDFNTPRPPQLTVGSSGGPLDNGPDDTKVPGQQVDGQTVNQSVTQEQNPPTGLMGVFGYAVLDTNSTWELTFHGTTGAVLGQRCDLSMSTTTKSFTCH